jgi:plastocyanin
VRCHWVKATKKRKRHKVCVKVKAKKKAPAAKGGGSATAGGSAPAPAPSAAGGASAPAVPVAPGAPPAPVAPVVAPPVVADPDPDPAPAPAAARLQATAREFTLQLSRPSLVAGPVVLELVNRGEDPHDLHVRPAAGGADVLAIGRTDASGVADATGTLAAGTYTLYCSLPGHEAAGMHATLTVGS